MGKDFLFWIKPIYSSIPCSNPEDTLPVLINRRNSIATQGIQVFGVMQIVNEQVVLLIESVKSATIRSYPQHTRMVLIDRTDIIKIYAIRVTGIIHVMQPAFIFTLKFI